MIETFEVPCVRKLHDTEFLEVPIQMLEKREEIRQVLCKHHKCKTTLDKTTKKMAALQLATYSIAERKLSRASKKEERKKVELKHKSYNSSIAFYHATEETHRRKRGTSSLC